MRLAWLLAQTDMPNLEHAPGIKPPIGGNAVAAVIFEAVPWVMVIEYLQHGNLHAALTRIGTRELPDDAIWRIMFCLAKAACALQIPPSRQGGAPGGPGPAGPPLVENPPHAYPGAPFTSNIVHMDLDPKNVFVGDFNNAHPDVPMVKVGSIVTGVEPSWSTPLTRTHSLTQMPAQMADFGLAMECSPNSGPNFPSTDEMWNMRIFGKPGWMLPEQWDEEWEMYGDDPIAPGACTGGWVPGNGVGAPGAPGCGPQIPFDAGPGPSRIAGRFGEQSNIWQIGMVMLAIITRREAPYPPYAEMTPAAGIRAADGTGLNLAHGMTHGWMLLDRLYDHIDLQLRHAVMHCLMHDPARRPSLDDIWSECNAQLGDMPPARPNRQWGRPGNWSRGRLRHHCETVFGAAGREAKPRRPNYYAGDPVSIARTLAGILVCISTDTIQINMVWEQQFI
jgi:serine/threonine protein kinase